MKNVDYPFKEVFEGYNFSLILDHGYSTTLELRQMLFYLEESIITLLSKENIMEYYGWGRISKLKNSGIRLQIRNLGKKNPSIIEFAIITLGGIIVNYSSIKEFFIDLKKVLVPRVTNGRAEIGGTIKLNVKKGTDVFITEKDGEMEIEIKLPLKVTEYGPSMLVERENKKLEDSRKRLPSEKDL